MMSRRIEFKKPSWVRQPDKKRKDAFLCSLVLFPLVFILISSNCFAEIINSRAAVTIDASTGEILFSKNPNRRLPPASTTKLMTAIVAMESENLSKVVTISKNASHAAPSKAGFKKGDRITIEGLLYAALLESANDAAVAISEAIAGSETRFVSLMNQKALAIGARDTKFINANGLPGSGQYTTALDLSKILNYALKIPKLREIIGTPEAQITTKSGRIFYLRSTDKLLWSDEKVIGGKTGYTQKAGHCFVGAAKSEAKTILVAVLGSPSRKNLWADTEKLISENLWVEGDRNNFFHREGLDPSSNIANTPVDGIVNLFSGPGLTVFQILEDINLTGSFRGALPPAVPETVIGNPVLPGAGLEDFIPGFGAGEIRF